MNSKQQRPLKKLLGIRGMGAALTAFVGLIIIYIAFGILTVAAAGFIVPVLPYLLSFAAGAMIYVVVHRRSELF